MKIQSLLVLGVILLGGAAPLRADEPTDSPEALARHWQRRREVEVVEQRQFAKAGRVELALFAGWIPNDAFTTYVPVGARGTYFFSESFGVELAFDYNLAIDTRLKELLHEEDAAVQAQIRDRQAYRGAVSAVWIPVYGKLAFHNYKIAHFDAYFLAGAGTVRTGASEIGLSDSFRPEGSLGLGLRFYLGRSFIIRLEGRDFIYYAKENPDGQGGGLTQAWELGGAVGVALGRGAPR